MLKKTTVFRGVNLRKKTPEFFRWAGVRRALGILKELEDACILSLPYEGNVDNMHLLDQFIHKGWIYHEELIQWFTDSQRVEAYVEINTTVQTPVTVGVYLTSEIFFYGKSARLMKKIAISFDLTGMVSSMVIW